MRNGKHHGHFRRNLITGLFTAIPLWITFLVFDLILTQLSRFGGPWVRTAARAVAPYAPAVSRQLLQPWFQFVLGVAIAVAALYSLGWLATDVVGKRLLARFDEFMHRIPLAHKIYGATKKLLAQLQRKPDQVERVVLIPFPSPEMKTVGFVTSTFTDTDTGERLAAVYVPTTPNPTSGYLEIMPLDRVVSTSWTVDEAMSFIISAGTLVPENISYTQGQSPPAPASMET